MLHKWSLPPVTQNDGLGSPITVDYALGRPVVLNEEASKAVDAFEVCTIRACKWVLQGLKPYKFQAGIGPKMKQLLVVSGLWVLLMR